MKQREDHKIIQCQHTLTSLGTLPINNFKFIFIMCNSYVNISRFPFHVLDNSKIMALPLPNYGEKHRKFIML